MVEAAVLISTLFSILGPAIENVARKFRDKQNITIDEAQNLLNSAISIARNKGQGKLDSLYNRLNSLQLIQSTPALKGAIDRHYKEINSEISNLKSDLDNIDLIGMSAQRSIDRVEDSSTIGRGKKANKLKGSIENEISKLKEIEQRF